MIQFTSNQMLALRLVLRVLFDYRSINTLLVDGSAVLTMGKGGTMTRKPPGSGNCSLSDCSPCTWHREPARSSRREIGPRRSSPESIENDSVSTYSCLETLVVQTKLELTWTGASFMSSSLTFSMGFLSAEGVEVVSVFLKPSAITKPGCQHHAREGRARRKGTDAHGR